jgi:hypothetical protein
MCGAPKSQTVTQRTELDPNLQRLLYGGIFPGAPAAQPTSAASTMSGNGGGGNDDRDSNDMFSGGSGSFASSGLRASLPGGVNTANPGSNLNQAAAALFDRPQSAPTAASRPTQRPDRFAMGGPVMPQMGIASLNQGQMPLMGGQLPNLSDPMVAATLAAAALRPQMQYGMPMGFAMGGMIEGPGTGTSDSVDAVIMQNGVPVQEALLSDGEFVMTADAVRGAGNGDREKGAAKMYEMMRQFERGGRV